MIEFVIGCITVWGTVATVAWIFRSSRKGGNPHTMLDVCRERFRGFEKINSEIKSKLMQIGIEIKNLIDKVTDYHEDIIKQKGKSDVYKTAIEGDIKNIRTILKNLENKK